MKTLSRHLQLFSRQLRLPPSSAQLTHQTISKRTMSSQDTPPQIQKSDQPPDQTPTSTSTSPPGPTQPSQSQPLPLPSPPQNPDPNTTQIDMSGGGSTVKLDHLGPLVVNKDGTLSRIGNWAEMSEIERANTLRILGKRNMLRREALEKEYEEKQSGV